MFFTKRLTSSSAKNTAKKMYEYGKNSRRFNEFKVNHKLLNDIIKIKMGDRYIG